MGEEFDDSGYSLSGRVATFAAETFKADCMKSLISSALVFMMIPALSCSSKNDLNVNTVQSFDLNRFLGTWCEIARYDHYFERGMDRVMAEYALREDGMVRVINSGFKGGRYRSRQAIAKYPRQAGQPGLLRVAFFWRFYSDYRILMLSDDYSLALISGASDKYLWIMSRKSQITDDQKEAVLREATARGFDTTKLIWVNQ